MCSPDNSPRLSKLKTKQKEIQHQASTRPSIKAYHSARFSPGVISSWSLVYKEWAITVYMLLFLSLAEFFNILKAYNLKKITFFCLLVISGSGLPWADELVKTFMRPGKPPVSKPLLWAFTTGSYHPALSLQCSKVRWTDMRVAISCASTASSNSLATSSANSH